MYSNEIITIVKDSLWLVPDGEFFLLRDSVNGETMIGVEEIAPLIEALQAIPTENKTADPMGKQYHHD